MLTKLEVEAGWLAFLGRPPNAAMLSAHVLFVSRADLVAALSNSDEFKERVQRGELTLLDAVSAFDRQTRQQSSLAEFVAPAALSRSPHPVQRCLIVGACLLQRWGHEIAAAGDTSALDFALIAPGGDLSRQAPRPLTEYDCAILQVPLRMILPDQELFGRSYNDRDGYEDALDRCTQRLRTILQAQLDQLSGRPVFVLNYMVPQQSSLGRLLPRYDLRNPVFFIERLNRILNRLISRQPSAHLLDVDQLSATIGRRLVQDDPFTVTSHGALISDYDFAADGDRLDASEPLSRRYPNERRNFILAAWAEVTAMMRTLRGVDAVKMVCVDIDDTLWRGVAAELENPDPVMVEGWPIGFAEALAMLKRHGIILALISKNDPAHVAEIWPKVFGSRLQMSDFAIQKISWSPKPEGIGEAIAEANVLPDSVLFIDDNPVERAAVAGAFPGIRTLGAPHLDWRRILLWSAETQVAAITAESSRRSDMIRAQGKREAARGQQSREAFLDSLGLEVDVNWLADEQAAAFPRALELINKTNQFNTTGQRWTREEAVAFLRHGGRWWHFSVRDRFTDYGLVGVLLERDGIIQQFVMSCRVFGMGVEQAALFTLVDSARREGRSLTAMLRETPKNGPCRDVFASAGWTLSDDGWHAPEATTPPSHIRLAS